VVPLASPARDRVRLFAVALGVLAFCALHAWRGYWESDFWEHAAVVRELSVRPFSPKHPLLSVDATHVFFSPYLLAIALVARATGASPMSALAIAGLLNIVFLVLALRRFLVRLLPEGAAATPYALLFILLLWGRDAWMWSGFLHIDALGFVAPYPSTFIAAAMFLCLSLLLDALDRRRSPAFVGVGLLVALCAVTHPPTAVVLFAALTALFLGRRQESFFTNGVFLLAAVVAGVVGAAAWPYFSFLDLLVAQSAEIHRWSRVFYQGVAPQVWPAIVALPVVAWRLHQGRRDPLVLVIVLLTVVYAIGAIAGKEGLGRVIAYIVVFVHVALGAAVATWESRLPAKRAWVVPACALIVAVAFVAYNRAPLRRIVRDARPAWPGIKRILAPVGAEDVVLTDSRTSYMVPAFTGRVVAWRHPVYWVPDHTERQHALERFFTAATDDERRAVIARYGVRWILLDRRQVRLTPEEEGRLLVLGSVVADRESLLLLDVGAECAAQNLEGRARRATTPFVDGCGRPSLVTTMPKEGTRK
jgi:hypothetical protein